VLRLVWQHDPNIQKSDWAASDEARADRRSWWFRARGRAGLRRLEVDGGSTDQRTDYRAS